VWNFIRGRSRLEVTMSSRPLDAAVDPDGQDPGRGPLSEQALADLERRRNLVASELSRLSAALDEALSNARALHVDAPRAPAPAPSAAPSAATPAAAPAAPAAPATADVTERLPRLQMLDGGSPWAPPLPERAAAVATGGAPAGPPRASQPVVAPRAPADERPLRAVSVLAALGVAAVALLAVVFVLQRGRGAEVAPNTGGRTVVGASEAPRVVSPSEATPGSSAVAVAPSPLAPSAIAASPLATPSRALDRVLVAAATAPQSLPDATQALVTRVPTLQRLTGPARAEEAADLYGLAVIAARGEDTPGPATALVEALAPEVTLDALRLLAQRRPAVVGAGVAPLYGEFAALPAAPASTQRARAQALLDAMIAGVERGTVSPGFYNVGAHVLQPYLQPT